MATTENEIEWKTFFFHVGWMYIYCVNYLMMINIVINEFEMDFGACLNLFFISQNHANPSTFKCCTFIFIGGLLFSIKWPDACNSSQYFLCNAWWTSDWDKQFSMQTYVLCVFNGLNVNANACKAEKRFIALTWKINLVDSILQPVNEDTISDFVPFGPKFLRFLSIFARQSKESKYVISYYSNEFMLCCVVSSSDITFIIEIDFNELSPNLQSFALCLW